MSLQNNTSELRNILTAVNALPEAGEGGGNVETCTVTIVDSIQAENLMEKWVDAYIFDTGFDGSIDPENPFAHWQLECVENDGTLSLVLPKKCLVVIDTSYYLDPETLVSANHSGGIGKLTHEGTLLCLGNLSIEGIGCNGESFFIYGDCTITATAVE